jgi:hypothetical protein
VITRRSLLWVGAGLVGLAGACTGGDEDDGGELCSSDPDVEITGNHGHVLTVPLAHVDAGTERSYDIRGNADHGHEITLSVDDWDRLRESGSVSINVSVPHDHTILLTC